MVTLLTKLGQATISAVAGLAIGAGSYYVSKEIGMPQNISEIAGAFAGIFTFYELTYAYDRKDQE